MAVEAGWPDNLEGPEGVVFRTVVACCLVCNVGGAQELEGPEAADFHRLKVVLCSVLCG